MNFKTKHGTRAADGPGQKYFCSYIHARQLVDRSEFDKLSDRSALPFVHGVHRNFDTSLSDFDFCTSGA